MNDEPRPTLFSSRVYAGSRTYFFDIKESQDGRQYLVISESRHGQAGYEHHRVMVFDEYADEFARCFVETLARIRRPEKKANSVDAIREELPNAYAKWSAEDDQRLRSLHREGLTTPELAAIFQRKPGAIESRLKKLAMRAMEDYRQ